MFTFKDLQTMQYTYFDLGKINYDTSQHYFSVLSKNGNNLELQSNNTCHCWRLVFDGYGYSIYHKHNIADNYHYQTDCGSLYDCVLYIVSHDEYQMRKRKNIGVAAEKKSGSYFWRLIDIYGVVA